MVSFTSNNFSTDLICETFSHLDRNGLVSSTEVCKDWNEQAKANALWAKFLFPGISFNIPEGNIREVFFTGYSVSSKDEIHQRIQSFIGSMQAHQIGSFRCLFPFNPGHNLEIKVQFRDELFDSEKVERTCILHTPCSTMTFKDSRHEETGMVNYEINGPIWVEETIKFTEEAVNRRSEELAPFSEKALTTGKRLWNWYKDEAFRHTFGIGSALIDGKLPSLRDVLGFGRAICCISAPFSAVGMAAAYVTIGSLSFVESLTENIIDKETNRLIAVASLSFQVGVAVFTYYDATKK